MVPLGGAAFFYSGSPSGLMGSGPGDAAFAVIGDSGFDDVFGAWVAGVGDVNADGYGDVVVGAPWYNNGESDEGAAFLFFGSASGISGSSLSDAASMFESNNQNKYWFI